MNIFKKLFKRKEEPQEAPEVIPEPLPTSVQAVTNDDFTFYERIRVMHVQQHPTSRFFPLNGLPVEEVLRRGKESWFMHQLGTDPTLEQVAYALSPQFAADKAARQENN